MAKQTARILETEFSIRLPKKLAGKKLIVVKAEELLRLKKQLGEFEDALGKITRGNTAHRQGRTRVVKSLSDLG